MTDDLDVGVPGTDQDELAPGFVNSMDPRIVGRWTGGMTAPAWRIMQAS